MIELNDKPMFVPSHEKLANLRRQVAEQRQRHQQQSWLAHMLSQLSHTLFVSPIAHIKRLPSRFALHMLVALMVPLALVLSQLPTQSVVAEAPATEPMSELVGLGPIMLDETVATMPLVGDPPLAEDQAFPVPISLNSRSALLAPLIVPATISGDVVKLRNGPGLAYDDVDRINGGTNIEVVRRHDEWLQIRRSGDPSLFWIAAELVDIPEAVIYTLDQLPADQVPPPPPPKVGVVREDGLNLRDGPGTHYVSMARMDAGQELTLIERFQGWYLVEYGSLYGWVTDEFLNIGAGIVERVPEANEIPDPNPALIGAINENSVNIRKGPGSVYTRISSLDAGVQVDLLARHKDWYKIALSDGTKAWVFSELVNVSPMAHRRVPVTNNIPAPPARPTSSGSSVAVNIPASGDVANYAVQFVGYRYVWGGASPSVGFDCSGLSSYVYRQFGVYLPHSAAAQYSTRYGAIINRLDSLAPGDLMYFVNTGGRGGITHVSIYIGGGRMVHAMTPSYGVQISSIWSSYWQNHFIGAVRPYR
jgi:cell wall-associated NlpC family hydrolase